MFPDWYYEMLEIFTENSGVIDTMPCIIYLTAGDTIPRVKNILKEHNVTRRHGDILNLMKEALGNLFDHRIICENQAVNGSMVTTKGGIFYLQTGGFNLK